MSIPSSTQRKHVPIGKYFLETGRITSEDLERALAYKQETNCKLGQALVALGFVGEEDLLKALRAQGKFHCLRLTPGIVDYKVAGELQEADARRFRCLPINRIADTVTVVMEDPTDVYAIDELAVLLKSKVLAVFAEPSRIREVMEEVYSNGTGSGGGISLGSSITFASKTAGASQSISSSSKPIGRFAPVEGIGSADFMPEAASGMSEGSPFSRDHGHAQPTDPYAGTEEMYPTFSEMPSGSVSLPMHDEIGARASSQSAEQYESTQPHEPSPPPRASSSSAGTASPESDPSVDDQVSKTVKRILAQAITEHASDVHIEPRRSDVLVRFRIDGTLHERATCPRAWSEGLLAGIKELADLDVSQRGLPQEGRAQLAFKDHRVDLRIATTPTIHGEGAVLRLVDGRNVRSLEEYDFSAEQLDALVNAIECRHGLVLATGPNGSGKTSTLYSILQRFLSSDTKVVTLEDPVEHVVEGVTQIQVDPRHGFGYAAGLRSILHQDPDVVLLGKIPDGETARSVVQAATFGQLILSNMHAFTASQAVGRLVDRGVERFLLADTLRVVVAQRLLRRICDSCRVDYTPEARILSYLDLEPNDAQFYRGAGCEECHGTGYKGRIGIYEIMPITPALRELIAKGAGTEELSACARAEGMTNLRSDALEKARSGLTTLQEVLAATSHA